MWYFKIKVKYQDKWFFIFDFNLHLRSVFVYSIYYYVLLLCKSNLKIRLEIFTIIIHSSYDRLIYFYNYKDAREIFFNDRKKIFVFYPVIAPVYCTAWQHSTNIVKILNMIDHQTMQSKYSSETSYYGGVVVVLVW